MFGILVSFLDGLFSGAMSVLGSVDKECFHHGTTYYVQEQEKAWQILMSLYYIVLIRNKYQDTYCMIKALIMTVINGTFHAKRRRFVLVHRCHKTKTHTGIHIYIYMYICFTSLSKQKAPKERHTAVILKQNGLHELYVCLNVSLHRIGLIHSEGLAEQDPLFAFFPSLWCPFRIASFLYWPVSSLESSHPSTKSPCRLQDFPSQLNRLYCMHLFDKTNIHLTHEENMIDNESMISSKTCIHMAHISILYH